MEESRCAHPNPRYPRRFAPWSRRARFSGRSQEFRKKFGVIRKPQTHGKDLHAWTYFSSAHPSRDAGSGITRGLASWVCCSPGHCRAAFWRARAIRPAHPRTCDWRTCVALATTLDQNLGCGVSWHHCGGASMLCAPSHRASTTQKLKSNSWCLSAPDMKSKCGWETHSARGRLAPHNPQRPGLYVIISRGQLISASPDRSLPGRVARPSSRPPQVFLSLLGV